MSVSVMLSDSDTRLNYCEKQEILQRQKKTPKVSQWPYFTSSVTASVKINGWHILLLEKGNPAWLAGLITDLCDILWVTVLLMRGTCCGLYTFVCDSHSNELTYMLSAVKKGNTPPIHLRMAHSRKRRRQKENLGIRNSESEREVQSVPSKGKVWWRHWDN